METAAEQLSRYRVLVKKYFTLMDKCQRSICYVKNLNECEKCNIHVLLQLTRHVLEEEADEDIN